MERLGDAEVGDDRRAAGEQDVLRLDVAVHDAVRVRVLERARHVAQHRHGRVRREPPVAAEPRAQRLALDERHRVVRQPVALPGGEHRHDVRVLQPRGDADLAREPLGAHPLGELGREHLHDDAPAERRLLGHEHARHPAAAELALEGVAALQCRL